MADLGGLKAMGKDPSGLAKPIAVDIEGNITPKNYGEKKTLGRFLNQNPTSSLYFGENVGVQSTVKPVDMTNYNSLSIFIKNESDIAVEGVIIYGFRNINDASTAEQAFIYTKTIGIGEKVTLNNLTQGLEKLNDTVYEGYTVNLQYHTSSIIKEGVDVIITGEKKISIREFPENAIIARHTIPRPSNNNLGLNISDDLETPIPADYRNYNDRAVYIENNSSETIGRVILYGYIDVSDSSRRELIAEYRNISPGKSITIDRNTEGFSNINDNFYQGLSVRLTFGAAGTGETHVYFLGRKEQRLPKVYDVDISLTDALKEALQPRTYPKKQCEILIEPHSFTKTPLLKSIGDDGAVYGTFGPNQLFKCSNGFINMDDTDIEMGQLFTTIPGYNRDRITHIEKTKRGYVAVAQTDATFESEIWFSENFESGFTKVADLLYGRVGSMNVSYYKGHGSEGIGSIFMVSEYYLGKPREDKKNRIFASYDHGQTWEIILTAPSNISTLTQNVHWHTHAYDEYDGRIWAVNGDGQNANTYYSYDLGKTWDIVSRDVFEIAGFGREEPQATLLIPCEDRVIMGHDSSLRPGFSILHKDLKYKGTDEVFRYELGQAVYPKISTGTNNYSVPPYVRYEDEIYFTVPSSGQHATLIIMGSGDGGRSFYKVGSVNLSQHSSKSASGILGVDTKGFMYIRIADTIAKVSRAVWTSR